MTNAETNPAANVAEQGAHVAPELISRCRELLPEAPRPQSTPAVSVAQTRSLGLPGTAADQ